jgi:hypothetical protein
MILDFAKSFRHLTKISVTSVTIRRSGGGAWCVTAELNKMLQYCIMLINLYCFFPNFTWWFRGIPKKSKGSPALYHSQYSNYSESYRSWTPGEPSFWAHQQPLASGPLLPTKLERSLFFQLSARLPPLVQDPCSATPSNPLGPVESIWNTGGDRQDLIKHYHDVFPMTIGEILYFMAGLQVKF